MISGYFKNNYGNNKRFNLKNTRKHKPKLLNRNFCTNVAKTIGGYTFLLR